MFFLYSINAYLAIIENTGTITLEIPQKIRISHTNRRFFSSFTLSGCFIGHCYAASSVSGGSAGGLIGGNSGTITFCYSIGTVNGFSTHVGGFAGYDRSTYITHCFWDIETSGQQAGVGVGFGNQYSIMGKTTAEMQTLSTFTDAGWDFVQTWAICEGTNYPRLQWAIPATDWVCPDGVDGADFAHLAAWWLADDCALHDATGRT